MSFLTKKSFLFFSSEPFQCREVRLVCWFFGGYLRAIRKNLLCSICVGFKIKPVTPDRTETEHATPNRNVRIAMARPTAVAPKVLESAATVGRIHLQSEAIDM